MTDFCLCSGAVAQRRIGVTVVKGRALGAGETPRGAVLLGLAVGNVVLATQVARSVPPDLVLSGAGLAALRFLPLLPRSLEWGLYVHPWRCRLPRHRCSPCDCHHFYSREALERALTRWVLPIGVVMYAVLFYVSHSSLDRHARLALEDTVPRSSSVGSSA